MKNIQWAYSIWHRNKHPIDFKQQFYEWRYKAKQILTYEYLNKCIYYVNNNAVKHWIVEKIEDYPHSSIHQFFDTIGTGTQQDKKVPVPNKIKIPVWDYELKEFDWEFVDFEF